ncbi:hypothetical protein A2706_01780 [Candidatus Peribacteria bacterium RIFCSPHIGHO2_01_FULL_51_35]|nr:MAG: hypothetical protein A2706_01780 [Candidatus Peribacteria bacterium RIFCSPHIGHO2_01_FULL_51_35]
MNAFSPSYDNKIARRYSASSLEQKVANKTALQKELGWLAEPKRPLLCLPAGMTDQLGGALLEQMLPGILAMPVELLIVGKGPAKYGSLFTELAKNHKHKIAIVPDDEDAMRKMYAAADMALFFKDPSHLSELKHCLEYGVVPVAPESKHLEQYDPIQENGFAFLYDTGNEKQILWHCFAALVRALETHRFPFDWRTIQRHGMEHTHA